MMRRRLKRLGQAALMLACAAILLVTPRYVPWLRAANSGVTTPPHWLVSNCAVTGTGLAAGGTSSNCSLTLPTPSDYNLACFTYYSAWIHDTDTAPGDTAVADLVVGTGNSNSNAYEPMLPYGGVSHIYGNGPAQNVDQWGDEGTRIYATAAQPYGHTSDIRLDAQIFLGGAAPVPPAPPVVMPPGADGVNPPYVNANIDNHSAAGTGTFDYTLQGDYICAALVKCLYANGCGVGNAYQ
jgi:hypothetical protein